MVVRSLRNTRFSMEGSPGARGPRFRVLSSAQALQAPSGPLLWAVPDVSRGPTIAPPAPTQAIG